MFLRRCSKVRREECDTECTKCSAGVDTGLDTHYIIREEERPVKQLEKAEDELEFDDWFSRGWFLCEDCFKDVIHT